jgi:hypothetical protein
MAQNTLMAQSATMIVAGTTYANYFVAGSLTQTTVGAGAGAWQALQPTASRELAPHVRKNVINTQTVY